MPGDFGRENYQDSEPSTQERISSPAEPRDGEDGRQGEGKTALVNSDICEGLHPGDTLNLRVVSVQEDQYVVEYEKEEEPSKESGEPGKAEMPPGPRDSEMASMYQ
jgi:hypothetical protein